MNIFQQFLQYAKSFLAGFGNWIWSIVPNGIKSKFNIQEAGLWGMISNVFGIFKYWYFLMIIPAIIVVYNLFQALQKTGILDSAKAIVTGVLSGIVQVSSQCFPLMLKLNDLLACMNGVSFSG